MTQYPAIQSPLRGHINDLERRWYVRGGETGGDAASGDEGGRGAVAAAGSLLSWLWGGARGGGGAEADPLALQADVKAAVQEVTQKVELLEQKVDQLIRLNTMD